MTPNTKIFTDLLRENRAFLTVSAAEYGAGHNAAEAFRILPDSMLGILAAITLEKGADALNVRSVAAKLNCSVQLTVFQIRFLDWNELKNF